jgi:hypothetical protein
VRRLAALATICAACAVAIAAAHSRALALLSWDIADAVRVLDRSGQ